MRFSVLFSLQIFFSLSVCGSQPCKSALYDSAASCMKISWGRVHRIYWAHLFVFFNIRIFLLRSSFASFVSNLLISQEGKASLFIKHLIENSLFLYHSWDRHFFRVRRSRLFLWIAPFQQKAIPINAPGKFHTPKKQSGLSLLAADSVRRGDDGVDFFLCLDTLFS